MRVSTKSIGAFELGRKAMMVYIVTVLFGLKTFICFAQTDTLPLSASDKNVFTRGLFMSKGNVEFKMFNNLYTETAPASNGIFRRDSYLTSFLQFTVGTDSKFNYGVDMLLKSNVTGDVKENSSLRVLRFSKRRDFVPIPGADFETSHDQGLSHLGGRMRMKPSNFEKVTFQQAIYVPTGSIDKGWIINTDLFFEHLSADKKFMYFGDLGIWYNTGQQPFPYFKSFVGTLVAKRLGPYVMLNLPYEAGPGLKIFILPKVELEFLYTYWLPLEWTVDNRKPQTFNFGLRLTNFSNY